MRTLCSPTKAQDNDELPFTTLNNPNCTKENFAELSPVEEIEGDFYDKAFLW